MKNPLCDRIRVYIYTAVSGFAWQGCDGDTSASLQKCVGQTSEDEVGGIRRWEVDGLNGTAIYRCHVRERGDFAGRDSKYVALAFLPFAHVGERRVDYAALWSHRYLAKPQACGEPLDGLEIDLSAEGLFDLSSADDDGEGGSFWTKPLTFRNVISGSEGEVLAQLGKLFQARKTELGSLSTRIERGKNGKLSAEPKYTPFTSVGEEVAAREAFESACKGNASEKAKTDAFAAWKESVEVLCKNADEDNGRFGHFLGFVKYAKAEKNAIDGRLGDNSAKEEALSLLGEIETLLSLVEPNLVGDEGKLLDWARNATDKQRQKLKRLAADREISRCDALDRRINEIGDESKKIAAWVKSALNGEGADTNSDGLARKQETPPKMAASIMELANRLAMERANVRDCSSELRQSGESTVSHEARERPASHEANPTTHNGNETAAIANGSRGVASKCLLWGGAAIVLALLICGSFMLGRLSASKPKREPAAPIVAVDGEDGNAPSQESVPGQDAGVTAHPADGDSNCATSGVPATVSADERPDSEPGEEKSATAEPATAEPMPAPTPTPSERVSKESSANTTNDVTQQAVDVKGDVERK